MGAPLWFSRKPFPHLVVLPAANPVGAPMDEDKIPAARIPASGGIPAPESSPQSATAAARKPPHAAHPQAGKSASTASRTRSAPPSRVPADRKSYLGCTAPRAPRHSHIRPQLHRQRQILLMPRAKPKPLGSEKILRSHCAFPGCRIPPTRLICEGSYGFARS